MDHQYRFREQLCPVGCRSTRRFLGRRGGDAHHLGLGVASRIYQCRQCGLIFPDPMPVPTTIQEHYGDPEKYYPNRQDFSREKEANSLNILQTVEARLGYKGRLLDIGSGVGELLKVAKEQGWDVTGLEPAPAFAKVASEYAGAEVIDVPLENRPFEPGTFDAVVIVAVLEHVFNPKEVLLEIHRVLKPGGVVWLGMPNEGGTYFKMGNAYQRMKGRDWTVNLSPTFPPYHIFGFTPKSLRTILRTNGFVVDHLTTYTTPSLADTIGTMVPRVWSSFFRWSLIAGQKLGYGASMSAVAVKDS